MIVKFHAGFNKWYISDNGGLSWYSIGKASSKNYVGNEKC